MDQRKRGEFATFELLARPKIRALATSQALAKVRIAANDNEPRVAAHRKAEQPDALAVDLWRVRPGAEQEINQALDIGRSFDEDRKLILPAVIERTVARMIDGRDD